MRTKINTLLTSRTQLLSSLQSLQKPPFHLGEIIDANHANFVLIRVYDHAGRGKPDSERAQKVYKILAEEKGVVVRYRGGEVGCEGCLRITVGTGRENEVLITKLTEVLVST
jgi:histidinol-phosphate aminotransferase